MSASPENWMEENHTDTVSPKYQMNLMKNLPIILRVIGAGAVIFAMYSFLIKGWENGNDIFRYGLMLGHTALLAVVGIASSRWLKESKGARLLLALSLVSIPANFATLGSFIYSQTSSDLAGEIPVYMTWSLESLNTALFVTFSALVILLPVIILGFRVLAKSMSKNLTLLYIATNMALLIPVRDPHSIAFMVIVLLACFILFSKRMNQVHSSAKTFEGISALTLQLLPLMIIVGRSVWFYSVELFLLAAISLTGYMVLRHISILLKENKKTATTIDLISILPALSFGFSVGLALLDNAMLLSVFVLPLCALGSSVLIYEIGARNPNKENLFKSLSVLGFTLSVLWNQFDFASNASMWISILFGLFMILMGSKKQSRIIFISGGVMLLGGFGQQISGLVTQFDFSHWASMAVFGVVSIVIASTLESKNNKFKLRVNQWYKGISKWNG